MPAAIWITVAIPIAGALLIAAVISADRALARWETYDIERERF